MDIDEIFAAKGKAKAVVASPPVASSSSASKKQKKKRKTETEPAQSEPPPDKSSKKRPAPQTIIDPSAQSAKRPKVNKEPVKRPPKDAAKDDFSNSRGTGPRKKTEEGWSVYKEDELGIRDEGGDTPLCPFDCDCCF